MENNNYLQINKASWNNRTDAHINSEFYDMKGFLEGKTSLNPIELELLGDLNGKSVLHLQCHFGQDSISLARMGAKVTGADLSDKAIDKAKEFAQTTQAQAKFICSDVYDLPNHLDEKFDLVFTSYGVIGWLPDLDRWAEVISHFLKPNGKLVFVEFHPVVWMFDDDFKFIQYNYFKDGEITETESGTYADKETEITQDYVSWNHSLSEVFQSLLKEGMTIDFFEEYDYSPYNCFNQTVEVVPKQFRIQHLDNKIPMVYSLVATKKP